MGTHHATWQQSGVECKPADHQPSHVSHHAPYLFVEIKRQKNPYIKPLNLMFCIASAYFFPPKNINFLLLHFISA